MTDPSNWEQLEMEEPIVRDVMATELTIMATERQWSSCGAQGSTGKCARLSEGRGEPPR